MMYAVPMKNKLTERAGQSRYTLQGKDRIDHGRTSKPNDPSRDRSYRDRNGQISATANQQSVKLLVWPGYKSPKSIQK